jgi:hypothetical protein
MKVSNLFVGPAEKVNISVKGIMIGFIYDIHCIYLFQWSLCVHL